VEDVKQKFFNHSYLLIAIAAIIGILGWRLYPYFIGIANINPVFLHLGPINIYWYGICITVGVALGLAFINKKAQQSEFEKYILDLMVWSIVGGVIGARLLFVILKWSDYSSFSEMINLSGGGLSIHGAVLGGMVGLILIARKYKLPILKALDLFVPGVLIGQLVGRLGNFFNQEAFGPPTNLPWKMFVAPINRPINFPDESFFHPTFLYEMVGLALILILILYLSKRLMRAGTIFLTYVIAYAILRFMIEFVRVDSDYLLELTIAQWGSLAMIITSGVISLILRYRFKLTK